MMVDGDVCGFAVAVLVWASFAWTDMKNLLLRCGRPGISAARLLWPDCRVVFLEESEILSRCPGSRFSRVISSLPLSPYEGAHARVLHSYTETGGRGPRFSPRICLQAIDETADTVLIRRFQ